MADIKLFGKTLEIPKRNEALVKDLRDLLEMAEDGKVMSIAYAARDEAESSWRLRMIEDDGLSLATLGALGILHLQYQHAMLDANDDEDDEGDDED